MKQTCSNLGKWNQEESLWSNKLQTTHSLNMLNSATILTTKCILNLYENSSFSNFICQGKLGSDYVWAINPNPNMKAIIESN